MVQRLVSSAGILQLRYSLIKILFDEDILMEIMINSIENTNDNNFKAFGALLISLPIISLMANITCEHLFVASQDERYLYWPFFICIFVFLYFLYPNITYFSIFRTFYLNLLTVCLVHFCNFTQVLIYI